MHLKFTPKAHDRRLALSWICITREMRSDERLEGLAVGTNTVLVGADAVGFICRAVKVQANIKTIYTNKMYFRIFTPL